MRRTISTIISLLIVCVLSMLAVGCNGGTKHELSPALTINNYLPPTTANAVSTAPTARDAEAAPPSASASGGTSSDHIAAKGDIVVIMYQGNNPASASGVLPTDVLRGLAQNALQGSTIPVGQYPSVTQSGQQQTFANGTGVGSTATATAPGSVTGGAQAVTPSNTTSSTNNSTHTTSTPTGN